jgi:hypothetical protein
LAAAVALLSPAEHVAPGMHDLERNSSATAAARLPTSTWRGAAGPSVSPLGVRLCPGARSVRINVKVVSTLSGALNAISWFDRSRGENQIQKPKR